MARPDHTPLLRAMRVVLDQRRIKESARRLGVVRRERKIDVFALVATITLAFSVGSRRTIDGLRVAWERVTGKKVARSAFYDRLTAPLAALLRELVQHALADEGAGARMPKGTLAAFKEVLAIDSTVIHLHRLLASAYPACRTNTVKAAAKLHTVVNVLDASTRRIRMSDERRPDIAPWRRVEDWVRGNLLLFDLGYYCFHMFDRIDAHGGWFLTRAKTTFNPTIVSVNRVWRGRSIPVVGERLRDVLPRLQRETLDAEVTVSFQKRTYQKRPGRKVQRTFRLVAVRNDTSGEYHVYLTNVAATQLPAEDVTATYALRWQIELAFKALKTHGRLDQLPSSKQEVVECLVWASVLSAIVSQRVAGEVRRAVPDRYVPCLRWASLCAKVAPDLLHALVGRGGASRARGVWSLLLQEAPDPNRMRRKRAFQYVPESGGG